MKSEWQRGIAIGLWILAGSAFLFDVLLPRSTGGGILGPGLLAAAVVSTALLKLPASDRKPVEPERRRIVLTLLGIALVFGTAFAVISEGDRRSFLYVAFVAVVTLALGIWDARRNG